MDSVDKNPYHFDWWKKKVDEHVKQNPRDLGKSAGSHDVYERFLKTGKAKKCCPLCVRGLDDREMATFEKNVRPASEALSTSLTCRVDHGRAEEVDPGGHQGAAEGASRLGV